MSSKTDKTSVTQHLELVIATLILTADGPRSGYDLWRDAKRRFPSAGPGNLQRGQVIRAAAQLVTKGLADTVDLDERGSRARKGYAARPDLHRLAREAVLAHASGELGGRYGRDLELFGDLLEAGMALGGEQLVEQLVRRRLEVLRAATEISDSPTEGRFAALTARGVRARALQEMGLWESFGAPRTATEAVDHRVEATADEDCDRMSLIGETPPDEDCDRMSFIEEPSPNEDADRMSLIDGD